MCLIQRTKFSEPHESAGMTTGTKICVKLYIKDKNNYIYAVKRSAR